MQTLKSLQALMRGGQLSDEDKKKMAKLKAEADARAKNAAAGDAAKGASKLNWMGIKARPK